MREDIEVLRTRYLFPLAKAYGYTPRDIDELPFFDFLLLGYAAQEWLKRPRL